MRRLLLPLVMAAALWLLARDLWRGSDSDGERR